MKYYLLLILCFVSSSVYASVIVNPSPAGATPGGNLTDVQVNNGSGGLSGYDNFQNNGSSVTVTSSMTVNAGLHIPGRSDDNQVVGVFNVFAKDVLPGEARTLFTIGSGAAVNQFTFVNQQAVNFGVNGLFAGDLLLGIASGLSNQISSDQSINNAISFWSQTDATNGMFFKTGGAFGRDMVFLPEEVETVKISSSAVSIYVGGSASTAVCWKADGRTLGHCASIVDVSGGCTCN